MTGGTAIVTGGGSGIGAATTRELARRGWQVLTTDLDGEAAARVADDLEGVTSATLDVTDASAARATAEEFASRHDSLDLWVSNAGISHMARFVDVSEADLERTLAVNLKGVFFCGQAAARVMQRIGRGGVIVNIASMAGKQGRVPFLSHYVASKFGVVGLTQAMALELAPDNIRVNSVCPGYVATAMQERELSWEAELRGSTPGDVRDMWVSDTPLGRLEQPEDVARVVAFLAGGDAAFVTGESVAVNGGAYMD